MDIICAKTGKHFNDVSLLNECQKHCERCSFESKRGYTKPESTTHDEITPINTESKPRKHDIFSNVIWLGKDIQPKYNFENPMLITVKMLLADKRSWIKEYREDEYTCVNFSEDVVEFMTQREIRCGYTVIRFDNGEGYAIVAFETDYGLVYFEPQTGDQKYPQIGKPYRSQLAGVPNNSVISEIEIKWNC